MRTTLIWAIMCLMTYGNNINAAAPTPTPAGLAQGIDQFALDLYPRLPADQNAFFSPASISTAFAMAYAGARGETAQQIAKVMHYDGPPDKIGPEVAALLKQWNAAGEEDRGYKLAVANALWGQTGYPFSPAFTKLLDADFAASLHA